MSIARTLVSVLIMNAIGAGLVFALAGRWDLWNVWAYAGLHAVLLSWNALAVYVKNPALFRERAEPAAPGRAQWTGYTSLGVFLLLQWGIAGLDQHFHWSDVVPAAWMVVGMVMSVAGWGLITWATLVNPFFSSAIRIQTDRGQRVIREGPYTVLRHPGYAGPLLDGLGGGLALNSLLSLIPVVLILFPVTVYRTMIEDRMLRAELPGYTNYALRVRYRLLPGVW